MGAEILMINTVPDLSVAYHQRKFATAFVTVNTAKMKKTRYAVCIIQSFSSD